jgi:hypothetical protein
MKTQQEKLMKTFIYASAFALSALITACTSTTVVGDESATSTETIEPIPKYEGSGGCAESDALIHNAYDDWRRDNNTGLGLEGTWSGRIDNGQDMRLSFLRAESNQYVGRVVFGSDPILPPATDLDEPYNCPNPDMLSTNPRCLPIGTWATGYEYEVHGVIPESKRLAFTLYPREAWGSWCALQTPHQWDECYFSASPNEETGGDEEGRCRIGDEWIPCGTFVLRTGDTCTCASDGCFPTLLGAKLDFVIDDGGNTLRGSVDYGENSGNVTLYRE